MQPALRLEPEDDSNQRLLAAVHPADWTNPEPADRYNLVVLGAGTAGLVSAAGAAGLGAKVALVERHLMGGDCLNVGCVPSKAVLRAAGAIHAARAAGNFGVTLAGDPGISFSHAMARMRKLRADIAPNDGAARFQKLGVDVFLGAGRFTGPDTLEVGGRTLRFARAVIATGARAMLPPIPGLAEAGSLTNETVFSLTELPRRLAVIGAGPIGCELAQAFRRFGAAVTVLAIDDQLLPREDADAAALVRAAFEREGITLALGTSIKRVERVDGGKCITFTRAQGGPDSTVIVDAILVAAGRAPNVDDVGLEAAGVEFDHRKGVRVDARLRTSNRRIFAAGDVAGQYQFTHAADAMARIVLRNALFFGRARTDSLIVPWATYTDPEVAHVGINQKQADANTDVATLTIPMKDVDRAILEGDTDGFARVHVDRKGRILGATIVARHAGEMIAELSLAMTAGITMGQIAQTIHPYPTQSEVIKKLADAHSRTRLTPGVRRFFTWLLAKRR
ncbi:MAG: mercuric reductase [Deltaproteobacteria bacterium]|nr:mercuric reductase [Deltaproteobacteria bacterium]